MGYIIDILFILLCFYPYIKNKIKRNKFIKDKDILMDQKFNSIYKKYEIKQSKNSKKIFIIGIFIIIFLIIQLIINIYLSSQYEYFINNNIYTEKQLEGLSTDLPILYVRLVYINFIINLIRGLLYPCFIIYLFLLYRKLKKTHSTLSQFFNQDFNADKIFNNFVKDINDNLYYTSGCSDTYMLRKYEEIYNNITGRFYAEDYISSDDKNFEMCEVYLDDNKSNAFMFCTTNSNKQLTKYVYIKSKIKLIKDNDSIELDDSNFNNKFNVYCEDKEFVYSFLTHDIIDELCNFKEKFIFDFDIILKENIISFRFYTGQLFDYKLNVNNMYLCYSILNFINQLTLYFNKVIENMEF